jgi:hypothetical protein
MQSSSDHTIDVTNEVGMSGKFLKLARTGQLYPICNLINQRQVLARKLTAVEGKLNACNHPAALKELATWCRRKHDFTIRLPKIAADQEEKQRKLIAQIKEIDELLDKAELEWEWEIDLAPMTSLVLKIVENPFTAERNRTMDEIFSMNPNISDKEMCRALDQHLARDGEVCQHLPKRWFEHCAVRKFVEAYRHPDCKNRVESMISKRRALLHDLPRT